jgi:hypothetical protein
MMTTLGDPLWARLPAGGWQVGFRLDSRGRTSVDVADPWGMVAYRVTATRGQGPSVDVACAGRALGRGRSALCWALAVGHAPAEAGQAVSVTFTGAPDGQDEPPAGRSEFRVTADGLWVAAAAGRYTHVRLTTPSATVLRPLRPAVETVTEPGLDTWTRAG